MRREAIQLFLLGFLTLFLELILIRYVAGNVWNAGYFPHLVLIATFVGMGIGFVFHRHWSERWSALSFVCSVLLLALLVLGLAYLHPAMPGFERLGMYVGQEFFPTHIPPRSSGIWWAFMSLFLWFATIVCVFALISQRTAKLFTSFPPLKAYTLDIAGSCGGILLFMFLSFLQVPSWVWFLFLIPLFLASLQRRKMLDTVVVCIALLVASGSSFLADRSIRFFPQYRVIESETIWSPYQKVQYADVDPHGGLLFVNNLLWQDARRSDVLRRTFYSAVYMDRSEREELPPYRRVLILGSGLGNDIQAALLHGAQHIDAVEIDPAILALGRKRHPERPYGDPRVRAIVDDGRAVLTRAREQYDLIVFALTESLFRFSPFGQLRLESYLYTVEAIRRAQELLTADGDLVFYNFYKSPWLTEKIEAMVFPVFGFAPRTLIEEAGLTVLVAGKHNHRMQRLYDSLQTTPPTDDWPFFYLRSRSIPLLYGAAMTGFFLFVVLLLFGVEVSVCRRCTQQVSLHTKIAFLLIGMAFLLLETKSIVQFSLLFGTTWFNQSLVFLAILLLVLMANWTAVLMKRTHALPIVALLLVSCLFALIIPLSALLTLESALLRFIFASLMTLLPIFFADLLFSVSFRHQRLAEHLFGWNLLGGALGGVIEYASMLTGYRALVLLVVLLYAVAAFLLCHNDRRTTLRGEPA